MYFRDNQLSGHETGQAQPVILRPSQRFYYLERTPRSHQFGWAPAMPSRFFSPLGEAPPPPKGLTLLEHAHSPKQPDPASAGSFITGPVTKLGLKDLNPGFIGAADQLLTDTSTDGLQTCLTKLITTQFQNYLASKSSLAPSGNDRLRIALVDLTGDKITKPDFAGWGSTVSLYGASVPKILALYAAFQLRRDLRSLAAAHKITNGRALEQAAIQSWRRSGLKSGFPDLVWLFDIRRWSGASDLDFTAAAGHSFSSIMENCPAGELIARVGFPYIASLTWQSGLRHPTRGGLWLPVAFCKKGSWPANPIRISGSNSVTALSVATYFTLLAQGRLVDDASSSNIKGFLRNGCVTSRFPPVPGVVASKCGIWSDYLHDCVLIDRGTARYVAVGLTRSNRADLAKYTQLFSELDKLIVRNNQTPKPSC